jgi:putative SOS response-associated peptidase YedK
MCGRFVAAFTAEQFEMAFGVRPPPDLAAPRYNVTPGRPVVALRAGADGGVEVVGLHWGTLPPWARDRGDARGAQINARSETAATKPMFRDALRRRRCLIPADGFYEWQRAADGSGAKQPWFVGLTGGRPFAFAGIWQRTREPGGGGTFDSCAILTTDANELVRPIHHRMPVILRPEHHALWLDSELQDPDRIAALLAPVPQADMVAHTVGLRVNDPRCDDPGLREPRDAAPPERRQGSLF